MCNGTPHRERRLRRHRHAGRRRPRRRRPPAFRPCTANVVNIGRLGAGCHGSERGEDESARSTHVNSRGGLSPQLNPTAKGTVDSGHESKSVTLGFLSVTPRTRGMIVFLTTLPVKVL